MANKFVNGFLSAIGMEVEHDDQEQRENTPAPAENPAARGAARSSQTPYSPAGRTAPGAGRSYTPAAGSTYTPAESRPMQPRPIDTPASESTLRPVHSAGSSKVIGMPSSSASGSGIRVVVYQPQSYDDTQRIIDELKSHRAIIINLENLKVDVAQRVLDFISGAVYALDGSVRKISRGIFLVAPSNVDISGNFISNLPANFQGNTGQFRPIR